MDVFSAPGYVKLGCMQFIDVQIVICINFIGVNVYLNSNWNNFFADVNVMEQQQKQ